MKKRFIKIITAISVVITGFVSTGLACVFTHKEVHEVAATSEDTIYYIGTHNNRVIDSPWCKAVWDGNNNVASIRYEGEWKPTNGKDEYPFYEKDNGIRLKGKDDTYETVHLDTDLSAIEPFRNGETFYIYYGDCDWWTNDGAHTSLVLISHATAEDGPSKLTLINLEKLPSFRGDTEEENGYLSFTIPATGTYYYGKIMRTQNELTGTTPHDFAAANIWHYGYIRYTWNQSDPYNVFKVGNTGAYKEFSIAKDWSLRKVTYKFADGSKGTETITPKFGAEYDYDGTTFEVTEKEPRIDYVTNNDRIKGDLYTPKDDQVFDKITLEGSEVDFSADFIYDKPRKDLVFTIHSKTQEITIEFFSRQFIDLTDGFCTESKDSVKSTLKASFDLLSPEDKQTFKNMPPQIGRTVFEDDEIVINAKTRYCYMITDRGYDDFLDLFTEPELKALMHRKSIISSFVDGEDGTSIIIVVCMSVLTLSSIGAYFALRKRKEE